MSGPYVLGERVQVHAFGYWYDGEVVKATGRTVTVRYTSGTGITRDKTVSLNPQAMTFGLVRHGRFDQ